MGYLNKNKIVGFTLLELIVVIALIGILATLAIIRYQNLRERARDIKRITDIKSYQKAVEIYNLEHGQYPTPSQFNNEIDVYFTIGKRPFPLFDDENYKYCTDTQTPPQSYYLQTHLEDSNNRPSDHKNIHSGYDVSCTIIGTPGGYIYIVINLIITV